MSRYRRVAAGVVLSLAAIAGSLAPTQARPTTSWGLDRIDQRAQPLDGQYNPAVDGAGVTVYLIDTGMDVSNPQFGGRASLGANFSGDTRTDCFDEMAVGHGTFVGGIVGGEQTGVANQANLVQVQALGCHEGGSTLTAKQERRAVAQAVRWVRHNAVRPAVVNMSLAFKRPLNVDRPVQRLIDSGIPVVAAAGNFGKNACNYSPAGVPAVITVGATSSRDRAWWASNSSASNQGRCVDVWAPGKSITSILAEGDVFTYDGVGATSWAAPFVTGAAALFLQVNPAATPSQVSRWIRRSATTDAISGVRSGTPNRLLYIGDL